MVLMTGWRGYNPRNMLIIPIETVVSVSATEEISVFVTACGKLFIGLYDGEGKGSLKEINLDNHFAEDAVIYKEHIIFVAEKGYTLSYNLEDESIKPLSVLEPKKTCSHGKEEDGRRVLIKQVSAGSDHVIFQSTKQELWVQGKGPALGLFTNKTENEITNPTRVDFFKDRKVLLGVAGSYFTIALIEALPPFQKDISDKNGPITDLDSYVRSCEQCRKETGDRVLFEDIDESEKCPLGLRVRKESFDRIDFLSPTLSSTGLDGRSSRNSNTFEESVSTLFGQDESEAALSDDQSCPESNGISTEGKVEIEMKDIAAKQISNSTGNIFLNAAHAKQFLTKPLSWVTSTSLDTDQVNLEENFHSYKYSVDTATELIKENVANAANLVATSVKTVGNKVGRLSQHFSVSIESTEDPDINYFTLSDNSLRKNLSIPTSNMKKSESYEENTFPRCPSVVSKRTHIRTGSSGCAHTKSSHELFCSNKNYGQIEICKEELIETGKSILNTEVWGWGSSNKGQLGLGDHSHRTMPTNITPLNHTGIIKIVCGSHHTAALTIDGQIFVWGSNTSGQIGPLDQNSIQTPKILALPAGALARDLGSGEDFLIIITIDGKIYFSGTQSRNQNPSIKEIHISDMSATFSSVLCSSQSIICKSGDIHPKVISYYHLDSIYFSDLKRAAYQIVLPIINSLKGHSKNVVDCPTTKANDTNTSNTSALAINGGPQYKIQRSKLSLLELYISIAYATASCLHRVWMESSSDIACIIPIIELVDELISLYQEYTTMLCDTLATNGVLLDSKSEDGIIEKNKQYIEDLIPNNRAKTNNEALLYILTLPLERIGEYEKFLLEVKNDTDFFFSPFTRDQIKNAHNKWKKLSMLAQNSKVEAEQTKLFWGSCSPKLFDALASPSRRVVLDSRKCPINLYKAGRFSSHSFILLSDVLIHYIYSTFVTYNLSTMWVESLSNSTANQSTIQITLPEDTLTLVCPTHLEKARWLNALQDSIRKCIHVPGDSSYKTRCPPLVRNATYVFTKNYQYKDATYSGQWFCGKMNGEGSLTWPEGRRYVGQFRHNLYQGLGRLELLSDGGVDTYEGFWRSGKLEGKGIIRYANKDIYVGFLHSSRPHGHGELKRGRFSSEAASVYTGEWNNGTKNGYGVLDEIAHGEKYHGMWQNNNRHGLGMVVTMNDVYYEGNFVQNKLSGHGLMIFEDGTCYEGELGPGGSCNGKGVLRYPCGDYIEGTLTGSWSEGIKVNGLLQRADLAAPDESVLPKSFGKLTVPASRKWTSLFKHCEDQLGIGSTSISTAKVWEALASFIEGEKQAALRSKGGVPDPLDGIDKIFDTRDELTVEAFDDIQNYLEKAFSRTLHPFGQLMHSLVGAFRATYGGVVSHPRLLQFAVQEVRSLTSRLHRIVRFLFPTLPHEGTSLIIEDPNPQEEDTVVTATRVIQPWLLPHIYASISPLYVKDHQKKDEAYWQRLLKWNKQSDVALMAFLGVDMKVWIVEGRSSVTRAQPLASDKDKHFLDAIECLQLLSTSFTPKDKLLLIHKCGLLVEKEVKTIFGEDFKLSMDELLPLFLYVVVRARIQHLGAEIGFICDLIDPHLQNGKLEHMFTTLEASYSYILHENSATSR